MHKTSTTWFLIFIGIIQLTNCTTNNVTFQSSSAETNSNGETDNEDILQAEGSSFFPSQFKSTSSPSIKFPDETEVQESRTNVQETISADQLEDIDENTAIDIILAATKSGRSFDVGEGTEDLVKVTTDPKIREQVAAGNDAQARGYIKQKLCDLGLMSCTEKEGGISNKNGYGFSPDFPPPHPVESGYPGNFGGDFSGPLGGDYGGGGGGIPFRDITLVQPVAIRPVGQPISAVPVEPFKGGSSHSPIPFIPPNHFDHPPHKPFYGGGGGLPPPVGVHSGFGKQIYAPPPPTPSRPFVPPYSPKPFVSGPFPGPSLGHFGNNKPFAQPGPAPGLGGSLPIAGGKVVEHIHHHIHHTPSSGIKGHGTYGIIGGIGGSENFAGSFDEYGAAQKPAVSLSTLGGSNLGTFREKKSETFRGDFSDNRIDECTYTCVPINQCASYDIVSSHQGSSGREVLSGNGVPNSGLVGYNIDPRTKYQSDYGTNSNNNITDVYRGSSSEIVPTDYSHTETENEDSSNNSTENIDSNNRRKREASTAQPEVAESPNSGQARFLGALMRDATFQNLTRLAGYEFGNDPSQNLLKIEGTKLRLLGRLIGFEPTFGVSFGLPGGYPQHGGGYPLNPVGNNPIVNPYSGDGISLGLVSVNPLVSLQVGKDKDKTKLIKPLVNFHVTPNAALFGGIKGLIHKKKVKKLAKLGLLNPFPAPLPVPIHYPHYPEYPPALYYPHRRPPPHPFHRPYHHHHHHRPPPPPLPLHHHEHHHHEHKHIHPIPVPVPVPIPTVTKYYESPVYSGKGWTEGPISYGDGFGYGNFRANKISTPDESDKYYKGENEGSTSFESEPEYGSSYGSSNGGTSSGFKDGPLPTSYNTQSSSSFNEGASYHNSPSTGYNTDSISEYSGGNSGNGFQSEYSNGGGNSGSGFKSEYSNGGGNSGSGFKSEYSNGGGNFGSNFGSLNPSSISDKEEAALIQELLQEGEITQEDLDEYKREGGFGNSGQGRRGRTLFPDESNKQSHSSQDDTRYSDTFRGLPITESQDDTRYSDNFRALPITESNSLGKRVLPAFNVETRLPPGASGPNAPASNSGSKFFPDDSHKLTFSSSSSSNRQMQNSDSPKTKSKIAFPGESSNSHHRVKRQLNSNYKSSLEAALARILNQSLKSQRQLNLGGACPSTYVCCRNPVRPQQQQQNYQNQNLNTYPANSNFGNTGFQNQNTFQSAPSNQNYLNNNQLGSSGTQGFSQGSGQCGKRNARGITGRVTNANYGGLVDGDTDYGEYPWQAALLKKDGYDNVYVCGGSLIDARHIVTAAHCIKGLQPSDLRVRLGEWDVNHETEFYPHVERDVIGLAIHPDFYAGNLFNDIAILRLDGYVDFRANPHISPICIPSRNTEFAGQRCFVTGWGKDAFGEKGKYQNVLKEVDMPVLRHFDCEQKLKRTRLGNDFVLHNGFLCAGGEEGKDACKGDGGGPLVCNTHGTWQLAGIVSWGVGCGQYDVPGVYIKVSQYQDWIRQTISGS